MSRHDEVAAALRRWTYTFSTEEELQAGVAHALESEGLAFDREVTLPGGCRLDFMEHGGTVAIEVKVDGSTGDLARQCQRYLGRPEITAIVVVTSKATHFGILAAFADRVSVVQVGGLI